MATAAFVAQVSGTAPTGFAPFRNVPVKLSDISAAYTEYCKKLYVAQDRPDVAHPVGAGHRQF